MNQSLAGEFASMVALLAVFFVPVAIAVARDSRRRVR